MVGCRQAHMLGRISPVDGASDLSPSRADLLVFLFSPSVLSVARLSAASSKTNSIPQSLMILLRLVGDTGTEKRRVS